MAGQTLRRSDEVASSVAVLIVNHNAGDALARCIESVLSQGQEVSVALVDNASDDGSAQMVGSLFGRLENVSLVFNQDNRGFSRAVNQAAALTRDGPEDYLLILNPDCELFPGSLRALVDALETRPSAAMAGPMVVDRHGSALRGTFRRFPDPWRAFLTFTGLARLEGKRASLQGVEPDEPLPGEVTEVDAVSGACMLVRKTVYRELGGMDEGYTLHCEDLDLMYRLQQKGFARIFVPTARVFHLQGLSSRRRPAWVHFQKHRGMQRFFKKFQAGDRSLPMRWLVISGIWIRFFVTLPWVLIRR
ncbi:MAG: glycosyltransferase family 2 protein [Gammaproteobacteria bacterium]|nr:glycosyltransferase family 2 protein [Gammaproteobacteria bacterium]